jgi:cytochrome c oxidase subunit 2
MALAIALIIMVIGSVAFHFWSPWWFTPLASNWGSMDDMIVFTFWVTGFVFVVINLFIAYCVIKFRYSEDRVAAYEPENKKLEGWLTVFTAIGVLVLLAPGLVIYEKFINVPDEAVTVEAVGQQWSWSFRYPGADGKLGTADNHYVSFENPLGINPNDPNGQDDIPVTTATPHLLLDQPVKMLLRSKDVLHDFYVPNFRAKMDLVPGLVTYIWLTPTVTGSYEILCAEYCGVGHYSMSSDIVVSDQTEYDEWIAEQPTFADTQKPKSASSGTTIVDRGRKVAQSNGCVACHSVDGAPSVGPTWQDMFGRTEEMADGSIITVDDNYIRESISAPAAKVVKGYAPVMPPAVLDEAEMTALVEYLKSFTDGVVPMIMPEPEVDEVEKGRQLSMSNGCIACHTIDGTRTIGPTWKGMYGRTETLADGSTIVVDDAYLIESMTAPNAKVVKSYPAAMPPSNLSDEDMNAIVTYIRDGLGD